MKNLTPPSTAPTLLRPGHASRSRSEEVPWESLPNEVEVKVIPPLSVHPALAMPTRHQVQTIRLGDRASMHIEAFRGIYSRYDPASVINVFASDEALYQVQEKGRLYFLKIILLPLAEGADFTVEIEGGVENVETSLVDGAHLTVSLSSGLTEPFLTLRDDARAGIAQMPPSPYNPVQPFIEKAMAAAGFTGGFYTIFAQIVGDHGDSSVGFSGGVYLIILTAYEDFETSTLTGGGNDFGWTGDGVVFTYIGLVAEETFSSGTLNNFSGGGWNGAGVVYTYVSLIAYEDFETGTLNGGGADFGWDNSGGAVPGAIAIQPINQSAVLGDTVGFYSVASFPATYQWYKNGVALTDTGVYSGTATQQLVITGVTNTQFDNYYVVMTGAGNNLQSNTVLLSAQDATTTTWANQVVTNGGAAPWQVIRSAIDQFYKGCVSDGIWSSMISVNCFAPNDLNACITPLLAGTGGNNPWVNHNFVASDLTPDGLIGNGSNKYLDTGSIPSTVFANTNSGGITCYLSVGNNLGAYVFGVEGSSFNIDSYHLYGDWSDGVTYFDCFGASGGRISASNSAWTGYISGNRTSSSAIALYKARSDTAHVTIASAATASDQPLAPWPVYCFGSDTSGTGVSAPSSQRLSFGALHLGLTLVQSSNFFNRIHTMRKTMGGGWSVKTPVINTAPTNKLSGTGASTSFSVSASTTDPAGILGYRWTKNGIPISNDARHSGAFTTTLNITNIQNSDYGVYDVWVYDANGPIRSEATLLSPAAQVADWVSRVIAAGGPTPDLPSQRASLNLLNDLSSDNLIPSISAMNGFAPDSLIASITPLIQGPGFASWTNVGFVIGDLTIDGLKGNGTASKYLNTGVHPTDACSQNSAGMSVYDQTTSNLNACDMGTIDAPFSTGFMLFPNNQGTGAAVDYAYDFTNFAGGGSPTFNLAGFWSMSRVGANDFRSFFGNVTQSYVQQGTTQTTATSGALSNLSAVPLLVFNADLSRLLWPSDKRISFAAVHSGLGLSQGAALMSRVIKFRQSLGGGLESSIITSQPSNLAKNVGDTAVFAVTATGGGLSYQWQKNGVNLVDGGSIAGSTTNTLTLTNVQTTDSDTYQCIITGSVTTYSRIVFLAVQVNATVTTWTGQVVTNGGALPTSITIKATDVLYSGLVTDGLISKILGLCGFVPDNLIASITPLIKGAGNTPWTNHSFVSGDLTANGLLGDGSTKYLDTGLVLTSNLNNFGGALYAFTHVASSTDSDFGTVQIGTAHIIFDSAFTISRNGFEGTNDLSVAAHSPGFFLATRVNSADHRIFFASSITAWTQLGLDTNTNTRATMSALSLFLYAYHNFDGSPVGLSRMRCSFFAAVTNFTSTDGSNLFNRVQTFRTSLGGGFV